MADLCVVIGTYTGGIVGLCGPAAHLQVSFSYSPSHVLPK